jgi:cytidylate kinase
VDANVSIVSAYPGVRKALSEQQRRIGMRGKVVMVGRDIGTVVLPEADLKIYLDASAEERAKRRYDELIARNEKAVYDEILKKVIERDHVDSTRAVAPLRPADDAVIIDSDKMDVEQVFAMVMELCK